MTDQIRPIGFIPIQPDALKPDAAAQKVDGKSFGEILSDSIAEVNKYQLDAERATEALATGKTDNIDEVLIAVRKADLAFKTLMQIRNKIIDAYDELMRMRV
ncbi:MAG: flagellar hook-basal body complex protein FliE [Planctomycetota bacterium]|nr:flagellar hook-basal body complex protein FliE [Planctomycetota bacterium]